MPAWLDAVLPYVVLGACAILILFAVVLVVRAIARRESYPTSTRSDGPLDEILRLIDKR